MLLAILAILSWAVCAACGSQTYLLGVGKADITGPVVEVSLSGYADRKQVGTGLRQRVYSRAFIIADASNPQDRIVYVVLDTLSGDTAVRNGVLEALKSGDKEFNIYNGNNIALTGTHSHAGPGGWNNYLLPQIPSLGFDKQSYQAIVDGTVLSIQRAHRNMQEGYLDTGTTRIADGAINRSLFAWLANPKAERDLYPDQTDKTMTLLRFRRASDKKALGVLTWFPVHGTSLLGNNTLVAGDNKGVAAWLLEEHFSSQPSAAPGFVAGFSQANVGDTTPNVLGAYCDDGSGKECSLKKSTCADGKSQSCHGRGPEFRALDLGVKSCYEMGWRQFMGAKNILDSMDSDAMPVQGPSVKSFHFYHDMRFWEFTLPNGSKAMTCPAALGYSFAAGTSDWPGAFDFTQGDSGRPTANPLWALVSGFLRKPSRRQKRCQGAKPILLDVGEMDQPFPWSPNIVDVQMMRVGQFFIIVSPSEATTMSGRRWKAAVAQEASRSLVVKDPIVVLGGPANTYAHYCATDEEYQVQRYEGASTLFGPHQLAAYINLTVSNMAAHLHPNSTGAPAKGPSPADNRQKARSFIPGVVFDGHPPGSWFGRVLRQPQPSYRHGAVINVSFQGANPRNDLRLERTYAAVERLRPEGDWESYRTDRDWFLVFQWRRTNGLLGYSEVDFSWDSHGNAKPGTYRFRYYGDAKTLLGTIKPIEGTSDKFTIS
ncbi:hypothetical protein XA68_10719 [Ophiocordyceps unilateralis]|uniref:Neutral ceramidase n=1 Tax=Ophiocordyceps unilateralis TaxID=268505 RepID=A0A2A9PNN2_OPHUN|nr:hypothetical protein XA68_10719 [Ophiocordyceps unilateralis]